MTAPQETDERLSLQYLITGALQHEMQIPERDAARLAEGMIRWMAPRVGGSRLYAPVARYASRARRAQRDEDIRRRWNGRNAAELCREYSIKKSLFYRIIRHRAVEAALESAR